MIYLRPKRAKKLESKNPIEAYETSCKWEDLEANWTTYSTTPESLQALHRALFGDVKNEEEPRPAPEPTDNNWEYYYRRGLKYYFRRNGQKMIIIANAIFEKFKYGTKFEMSGSYTMSKPNVLMPNRIALDLAGIEFTE